MRRIGALSDEMTPVISDLGDVAPDINRMMLELGPFSKAGIPALDSLGEAGKIGIPAMQATRSRWPRTCSRLGKVSKPVAQDRCGWCSSPSRRAAASSACSTTPSTKWPPSTASTPSATTCARA